MVISILIISILKMTQTTIFGISESYILMV